MLRYEKALIEGSRYVFLTVASAQQRLRLVTMCKCDAVLLDYNMRVLPVIEPRLRIGDSLP
jgi:CheY-like chemotaxis protein